MNILKFAKRTAFIAIVSALFACSKADESVPMTSANQDYSSSFVKSKTISPTSPTSTYKGSGVVGGDDKEDDDDNRGRKSHLKGK